MAVFELMVSQRFREDGGCVLNHRYRRVGLTLFLKVSTIVDFFRKLFYSVMRYFIRFWSILLIAVSHSGVALELADVDHQDPIVVDADLSLRQLFDKTLELYPDSALAPALQQENQALQTRGQSWLSEAPRLSLSYLDDVLTDDVGYREFEGALELPLWNWGQREKGRQLAERARSANDLKQQVVQLQVAGLLRSAIWDIALRRQQLNVSEEAYQVAEQLFKKIQLRVELGDLPKIDLLLAESELLEQRTRHIGVQAQLLHAHKQFISLTQDNRMPAIIDEQQSPIVALTTEHPLLQAANAVIERRRAELDWVKAEGSGQSTLSIGGKTERDSRSGRDIESIGVSLSVPFGGSAHRDPGIAAKQLQLSEAISRRDHLYRKLEVQLHEIGHHIDVLKAELNIAEQRKTIAEEHLRVTELSFNAGEINLLDTLKIKARAYATIQHANELVINLHKHIALYNQAVGVLP